MNRVAIMWAALLLGQAVPACARLFDAQAQVRYDFLQTKEKDQPADGDGRLSTSYNLVLRRPFTSTLGLLSDLTYNSSDIDGQTGRQSSRNWAFNVYSNKSRYTFVGRVNRSDYGSASSTGYTTNYNTSLFLREPAYPAVNIQYLRNVSGNSYGGQSTGYTTSTWLLGSYYDMPPFRFAYDRTKQVRDYAGGNGIGSLTQRSSLVMNHALMQGLTLSGELSRHTVDTEQQGRSSSTSTDRKLIRLSAVPTPAIAADLDYSTQSNEQESAANLRHTVNDTLSFSIRSQILPGLSLDFADQRQSQEESTLSAGTNTSRNRNLGLSARLAEGTMLTGSLSSSDYDATSSGPGSKQDSMQLALSTGLTNTSSLSLNYGRSRSSTGEGGRFDSRFAGISLRDRSSDKLSMGATYYWSKVNSVQADAESTSQSSHAVDVDLLWTPTYDLGVNLRVSYQASNGSSISESITPSLNLRWQVDSSTNLALNYGLQRVDQWDWTTSSVAGQRSRDLSLRMTHAFQDGSALDVSYDFHGSNTGDLEWERQLRAYFTTRL